MIPMTTDCPFCHITYGRLWLQDAAGWAFRDAYPISSGHTLVVPRKHVASMNELEPGDALLLGSLLMAAQALARARRADAKGYRLVVNTMAGAGQTVFHLHVHLLAGRPFSWPPG